MGRRHRLGLIHRPLQRDRIPRGGQGYIVPGPTGDPYWANVVLLAGNDNAADTSTTFIDQSSYARTLTAVGNAQYDTAFAPTGMTSSILLDGTGDEVTAASAADLNLSTSDFTYEAFFYHTTTGWDFITTWRPNAGSIGAFAVGCNPGNSLVLYASSTGASWNLASNLSIGIAATNTWYYVAVKRSGTSFTTAYGTSGATTAGSGFTSSAALYDNAGIVRIGSAYSGIDFAGNIACVRMTIGTARDISTVPSLPFPTF